MKHIVFDKDKPDEIILTIKAQTQEEAIQKAYDKLGNKALELTYKQEHDPCHLCTDKNGQNIGNMYVCPCCGRSVD